MNEQSTHLTSQSHQAWLVATLVVLAGLLTYANSFRNEFVYDDASSVLIHRHVQDPSKLGQLFLEDQHAFGRGEGNFYRPLVSVSFMVDYVLSGGEPPAEDAHGAADVSPFLFHVTNTAWHIAASLLLLALLARLGVPTLVLFAAPLLHVVHPLHTEAVTYISGRADSMAAAFLFAGLYFITWDESPKRIGLGALLATACYIGGLLSKESAMIFPLLALLVIAARRMASHSESEEAAPPAILRYLPMLLSAIVFASYILLRRSVFHFADAAGGAVSGTGQRIIETLQSLGLYMKLIVWPTNLHMERSLFGVSHVATAGGAIALVAILALAVYGFRAKRMGLAIGASWFVVTWLPISGLFPLNAPMAEHWMYVPLAGLLWAVLSLLAPAYERNSAAALAITAAVAFATGALILASADRNRDWYDNETFYRATLEDNPYTSRIRYNLAVTYESLLDNPAGARREFNRWLYSYEQLPPAAKAASAETALEARLSLGKLYLREHLYPEAASHFSTVLNSEPTERIRPLLAEAAFGMGEYYFAVGNRQQAVQALQQAVQLNPGLAPRARAVMSGGNPA